MTKAKILIIDDSEVILAVCRHALEQVGHEVVTSDNPLLAASQLRRHAPDLVLLDINMPAVTGDVVTAVLQSHGSGKEIPIFLHSDIPVVELEARARKAGAAGYICKTNDPDRFVAEVEAHLASRRAR